MSCPYSKVAVKKFVPRIKEIDKQLEEVDENKRAEKQDMFAVATEETPKVLADIFESVAGAIYGDSGDQFEIGWSIYRPFMNAAFQLF